VTMSDREIYDRFTHRGHAVSIFDGAQMPWGSGACRSMGVFIRCTNTGKFDMMAVEPLARPPLPVLLWSMVPGLLFLVLGLLIMPGIALGAISLSEVTQEKIAAIALTTAVFSGGTLLIAAIFFHKRTWEGFILESQRRKFIPMETHEQQLDRARNIAKLTIDRKIDDLRVAA